MNPLNQYTQEQLDEMTIAEIQEILNEELI